MLSAVHDLATSVDAIEKLFNVSHWEGQRIDHEWPITPS